jgi:hypothetical protein
MCNAAFCIQGRGNNDVTDINSIKSQPFV